MRYNPTLAKQILAKANIDVSKLPTLEFTVLASCPHCVSTAQIVQANLAQIGINVKVNAVPTTGFLSAPPNAGFVSFDSALNSADKDSHLTWFGTATFPQQAITPADLLLQNVNRHSICCNYAIYSKPVVQACVDGFFSIADVSQLKSICRNAQAQIDADSPYIWIGNPTLVLGDGSIVYDKAVISEFLIDPVYTGQTDTVIFNTVKFTNGQ